MITRLDRLGRSVLHLITLGAELRERGIGLKMLEQGIDTATAEGRAMLGMLSVLAELQRELIVANTRDGLAAARARGRTGGRPSKLSADQIELAQRLYDAGEHTVAQIADMLKVPRTTIYGHLNTRRADSAPVAQESAVVADPPVRPPRTCPSCGYEPTTRAETAHQRADLAVTWHRADPHHRGTVISRHHCRHCEPGQPAFAIVYSICGDGPILAGALAEQAKNGTLTEPVRRWLTAAEWTVSPGPLMPKPHIRRGLTRGDGLSNVQHFRRTSNRRCGTPFWGGGSASSDPPVPARSCCLFCRCWRSVWTSGISSCPTS